MVIKSIGYLSLILGMVLPVTASLATNPSVIQSLAHAPRQISLEFPPAPDGAGPRSTAGGATRGNTSENCGVKNGNQSKALTALVPSVNTLTVSANPTFFVYVPQLDQSKSLKGEFELIYFIDDKKTEDVSVYSTNVQLPTKASIVQIPLPKTVTLEPGIQYRWSLSITCDTPDTADVAQDFVGIDIQRHELTPTLKSEIEQAKDPLQKAEIYAREELWQDTLMMMAQLRDSKPEEWKNLLNSIKIEESIIEAPFFVPERTVNNSEE